jgi:tetratricopeptide (TPR) repeat protein
MDAPILETWPLAAVAILVAAVFGASWFFRRQALAETGHEPERMARAIAAARRVASGKSRERRPLAWARAQMQLVMLLAESGGRNNDPTSLSEALAIVTEVIPVLETGRRMPELATALYYRGRAEWGLGMLEPGARGLEDAVATLRGLLELKPWPRHLLRAVVLSLPAVILMDIGERRDDPAAMEEGVKLAREAAAIARRRIAVEWGIAHRNLCHALAIHGRHMGDTALLEEAVETGRAACAALSPARYPDQWALAQASVGHALCALGELQNDPVLLEESLSVMEAAHRAGTPNLRNKGRAMAALNAGSSRLALARATGRRELLDQAVADLRAALAGLEAAGLAFPRAETGRLLGDALAALGESAAAEETYRTALAVFAEAGAARQAAETEAALARLKDGAADMPAAAHIPVYQVR